MEKKSFELVDKYNDESGRVLIIDVKIENIVIVMNLYNENTKKCESKYRVFFGQYFPEFGLNLERVSLGIQSECGEIHTGKNSVFGHFSHSGK